MFAYWNGHTNRVTGGSQGAVNWRSQYSRKNSNVQNLTKHQGLSLELRPAGLKRA